MESVVAGGHRLEVLWYAAPVKERPTIVLLHDALGSAALWRDFPADLARRTGGGVMAYSRFGNGFSERRTAALTATYLHEEALVVLPEVLGLTHIDRPVIFGHSDGATIALLYAAGFPQSPRGLVLEAPHVFVEDRTAAGIEATVREFHDGTLRERLKRHHVDADATFGAWRSLWLDPTFRTWNIEAVLPRISTPVLVIQGEDDEYGTPAQVAAVERAVPRAETLMLARCGHVPHRERPAEVLDAAAGFIAALA